MRDTVRHLHASDRAALAALAGEDLVAAFGGGYDGAGIAGGSAESDLAISWRRDRDAVGAAVLARPADAGKIPWFGPPMSAASFLTARLMETWAHGVDVRDAAGLPTVLTDRLRHVADLGVRTRGWSYSVHGLEPPTVDIGITLSTPGGPWTWGSAGSPGATADATGTDSAGAGGRVGGGRGGQTVTGPALDFCLLVVQRRARASLALVADGPDADRWLDIAQAFAGQATENRT